MRLLTFDLSLALADIDEQWQVWNDEIRPDANYMVPDVTLLARKAHGAANAAKATMDQVESFLSQEPRRRRNDCKASFGAFKRLTEGATTIADITKSEEEMEATRKQVEMAEITISESRNAITCMCLNYSCLPSLEY